MRIAAGLLVAIVALAGARAARSAARSMARNDKATSSPFAPSPAAAPFVAIGFREAAADILYVRMIGYFIGEESTGHGVADLAEAVVALDPTFYRVYEHGANAMTLAKHGVDQSVLSRSIRLLEEGIRQFPHDWRMPYLAGQIYTQDLVTDDPQLRRAWDERGLAHVEAAIRKPGAPAAAATWAASMHSKLGARQRAIAGLKEMLLITNDPRARDRLLKALAELMERDADVLRSELFEERMKFERRWLSDRPALPATVYVMLGPRLAPGFDMANLATGGVDVYIPDDDRLEPLE